MPFRPQAYLAQNFHLLSSGKTQASIRAIALEEIEAKQQQAQEQKQASSHLQAGQPQ